MRWTRFRTETKCWAHLRQAASPLSFHSLCYCRCWATDHFQASSTTRVHCLSCCCHSYPNTRACCLHCCRCCLFERMEEGAERLSDRLPPTLHQSRPRALHRCPFSPTFAALSSLACRLASDCGQVLAAARNQARHCSCCKDLARSCLHFRFDHSTGRC